VSVTDDDDGDDIGSPNETVLGKHAIECYAEESEHDEEDDDHRSYY
jgi:hypothetical protein